MRSRSVEFLNFAELPKVVWQEYRCAPRAAISASAHFRRFRIVFAVRAPARPRAENGGGRLIYHAAMSTRPPRRSPTAEIRRVSATAEGEASVDGRRLSEIAYEAILEGLFNRKVPTGAFLSQNDLVRMLGVPVQPLRDALRILEAEGVLTIHPRAGIEFLKPDLELARSTYQFRSIIERAAARTYAENGDAVAIAQLIHDHEALIAQIGAKGLLPEHMAPLQELEDRLHGEMVASLRNPLIETTARRLKNYLILIKLDRRVTAPLALRTLREHMEVLDACKKRDADQSEAALLRHFQAALQRILGMV
jgi:DNA-binding GntR family transcriptional regulator